MFAEPWVSGLEGSQFCGVVGKKARVEKES